MVKSFPSNSGQVLGLPLPADLDSMGLPDPDGGEICDAQDARAALEAEAVAVAADADLSLARGKSSACLPDPGQHEHLDQVPKDEVFYEVHETLELEVTCNDSQPMDDTPGPVWISDSPGPDNSAAAQLWTMDRYQRQKEYLEAARNKLIKMRQEQDAKIAQEEEEREQLAWALAAVERMEKNEEVLASQSAGM